jgi:arylsulfatase A-like enzyme
MGIYPTLTDLWGLPTPGHVEGRSLRQLLGDPTAPWDHPALTTYRYRNHAVRTEGWCCIRYADGGEELDDEAADPYEWTNLAGDPRPAATKAGLAKALPARYHPDIGRRRGGGAARQAAREEGDR